MFLDVAVVGEQMHRRSHPMGPSMEVAADHVSAVIVKVSGLEHLVLND